MQIEDVRIHLKGFEKKDRFGCFVKSLVDDIHLEAPSDSTTTASFTKSEAYVTGSIQISSSEGVFSARAEGCNPRKVALEVARELRKQLRNWRRTRFFSNSFGQTA